LMMRTTIFNVVHVCLLHNLSKTYAATLAHLI